jgi:hypothetical protein
MRLISLMVASSVFVASSAMAQKFIRDDVIASLLRQSMPPDAQCTNTPGIGPSCEFQNSGGRLTAGKELAGDIKATIRFRTLTEETKILRDATVKFVSAFGFSASDISACIDNAEKSGPTAANGGYTVSIKSKDYIVWCGYSNANGFADSILVTFNNSF